MSDEAAAGAEEEPVHVLPARLMLDHVITHVLGRHPENVSVPVKWVLLGEQIAPETMEKDFFWLTSEGVKTWDARGLMHFGLEYFRQ